MNMRYLCLIVSLSPLLSAQDSKTRQSDDCNLKLDRILAEIRNLRADLSGLQTTTRNGSTLTSSDWNLSDSVVLGDLGAPITVVEFSDYQCPACKSFYELVLPQFKKKFIDSGVVRYYVIDLPLDIHPNAMRAAEASRCANDEGKFWAMHDALFSDPKALSDFALIKIAGRIELDQLKFEKCMADGKYVTGIRADAARAIERGATGTPAFLIGRSTKTGVAGDWSVGVLSMMEFEQKVKTLLDAK